MSETSDEERNEPRESSASRAFYVESIAEYIDTKQSDSQMDTADTN